MVPATTSGTTWARKCTPVRALKLGPTAAGLGWSAVKVPALVALNGPQFDHIEPAKRMLPAEDRSFVVRSDNGAMLGYVSGESERSGYQIVQPRDVLDWFQRYISVDDRFELDVCGSLDGGRRIWATAKYNGDVSVGGENHAMRVLMSTTYDASGATINQCTATRVVCQNTLRIAHGDARAQIKTRHSTKFDAAKVGRELAQLAQGFAQFKRSATRWRALRCRRSKSRNFSRPFWKFRLTRKKTTCRRAR